MTTQANAERAGVFRIGTTQIHRLGFRAMLAGTLANFVTATIAGFLL